MELRKAEELVGDAAVWELRAMKRALESMTFLNDEEENRRLEAVKTLLRAKKRRVV